MLFFFFFFLTIALTSLTFQSPGNAADIIDLLDKRLRENSWIVSEVYMFKKKEKVYSLIVIECIDHL